MGKREDKNVCPNHAKRNLQEHSTFLKSIFGEKNTPKIHILCQKIRPKMPKIRFFPPKIFFGKSFSIFGGIFGESQGGHFMRSKNFKGSKCVKMKLNKSEEVVRTFDNIQTAYAQILDKDESIQKIQCNVVLEEIENGEFTTDFLCVKADGDLMVRECVFRKKLSLPRTCKLLDISHEYWRKRGIDDWGIVIEKEEKGNAEE